MRHKSRCARGAPSGLSRALGIPRDRVAVAGYLAACDAAATVVVVESAAVGYESETWEADMRDEMKSIWGTFAPQEQGMKPA